MPISALPSTAPPWNPPPGVSCPWATTYNPTRNVTPRTARPSARPASDPLGARPPRSGPGRRPARRALGALGLGGDLEGLVARVAQQQRHGHDRDEQDHLLAQRVEA